MSKYVRIDGQRVAVAVARDFERLRAAFKKQFGLDLLVTSGTRTRAEQQALYDAYIRGRGNLAARPGTSNHEEGGPIGPRALDLRDSGRDGGVTRNGSTRSNWLRANAPKYSFHPAGFRFSQIEPWHYEWTGSNPFGSDGDQDVKNQQSWLNKSRGEKLTVDGIKGSATTAAFKRYQTLLKKSYGYTGAVDGIWGKGTQTAHQRYYDAWHKKPAPKPAGKPKAAPKPSNMLRWKWTGIQEMLKGTGRYSGAIDNKVGPGTIRGFQKFVGTTVDGLWGPNTVKAAQRWLKDKWGYKGAIDGLPGAGTKAAWDRAEKANRAAF